MSIKAILQGNFLGHPLHPALVHLPMGLFPAALVFDIVAMMRGGDQPAVRVGFWCIAVGIAAALAAAPTGLADWWDIKPAKPARKLGLWHLAINVVVLAIFAVSLMLRWNAATVSVAAFALCVIGNVGLAISGYLGGRMVFEHGISVARQSKQEMKERARAGGAR